MSEEKPLQGIDRERVGQWLAAALPQAAPPFAFRLIAAGGSHSCVLPRVFYGPWPRHPTGCKACAVRC